MAVRGKAPNRTLFIGDNLDALRVLESNSVDLIYLDPPGFTGRTYAASHRSKARGVEFNDIWTPGETEEEWLLDIEVHHPDAFKSITATNDREIVAYLAFITVRLVELKRILKPAGSIYLHSNVGVSADLRAVMNVLFGRMNFRNEIVWKRPSRRTGDRRWLPVNDRILFYTGGRARTRWNPVPQEHFADYWTKHYRHEDERGRFHLVSLINRGMREGDQGEEWRGIRPADDGSHWSLSLRALKDTYPDRDDIDGLNIQEKLDLLDAAGLIHWPSSGRVPRRKIYADMVAGGPLQDILLTIEDIDSNSRERTGWPLQKPEALLDLIISVSSDPEDVVLDPFCGSGTTCVVAERLGRRWVGMEQVPQVEEVLSERMASVSEQVTVHVERMWSSRPPSPSVPMGFKSYNELSAFLYTGQKRRCFACRHEAPSHLLTVRYVTLMRKTEPNYGCALVCHYCANLMQAYDDMDAVELELFRRGIIIT